ncbi:MAG: T9SS type A sorting domain-containing protein [Fibrobacteres bacterium]|nr:T9SS type A sorting domain-containing protein [Fibrobacterota bacterium]
MKLTFSHLFLFIQLSAIFVHSQTDHGVPVDSFPSWREQALIVFTNAVRTDPQGFRDKYIGNYQILLPKNFQAQRPLFWNVALNRAARFHSIDMATNCGMQHNSCDGTAFSVRVKKYYTASGWLGENIATGYTSPQAVVIGWLRDDTGTTVRNPSADSSAYDGHRRNIMNSVYREMGAGYAKGAVKWYEFWTQDFGGGKNIFSSRPVVIGSHLFLETDKITFMVSYYDSTGRTPQSAQLNLGDSVYPLTLHLGSSSRGSYAAALPKKTTCRQYHFSFKDGSGNSWRYPEKGRFSTYGEGSCTQYYLPDVNTAEEAAYPNLSAKKNNLRVMNSSSISINLPASSISSIYVTDLLGRKIPLVLQKGNSGNTSVISKSPLRSGVYIAHIETHSGLPINLKFLILR